MILYFMDVEIISSFKEMFTCKMVSKINSWMEVTEIKKLVIIHQWISNTL